MSSGARYTTFDPADRFSWPSEEVAQRLTSAWLLECCSSRCCYPWKRRQPPYPGDKSGSARDSKKDDKKLEGAKSFEVLSRANESDSEESPLNLISVKNYQGKNEMSGREKISIKEDLVEPEDNSSVEADDEDNDDSNEDIIKNHNDCLNEFKKKFSPKSESIDDNHESKFKALDSLKKKKFFSRKYSLDISTKKIDDRQVFRKYSLDANETQKLDEARKEMIIDQSHLHAGDYIESDGSPLFKRCVSFREKVLKSKQQSAGDNGKTECMDLLKEENVCSEQLEEPEKKRDQEIKEKEVDEEKKGLFDSDSESEVSEIAFEFADDTSSDDFELRRDVDNLPMEVENKKMGKTRILGRRGIVSLLPKVRETDEEVDSLNDDGSSLSEACSTPIIGAGSRTISSHAVMDMDDIDRSLHSGHLATRASLSSLGARSDSMASVYSGAGEGRWCGSVAVRGEVEFSLQYDYKQLTFEVHVTQCRDLAPVDVKRNRSDPYVKVYLLPDKSKSGKRKTKVKKHTLNPVFDETLKFHMSLNGLETRTLWLTVWHSDMFGRNDFLGEVRMPLENKIFDDPRPQWYSLQERTEPFDDPIAYKGEVIVGLKFVPPDPAQQERERESGTDYRGKTRKNWSRGALHVLVKEARNLQMRAKHTGSCDPFCKSYLLPDKGRSGKQKTGVVRRSGGSPVWNHIFVYKDVSLQELAERGLELTVWDHDRIASNEFLGGVRFNLGTGKHYGKLVDWMDATGRELSLWQSMLERPNFWVEGAVTLRPNLHNHGKNGSF